VARTDYTGVPTVEAPIDQPNDQLRIDASPASFGAPIAQGAEALGQGAMDQAKFYSQVAADHATNNYLDARTRILHGDPSQPMLDAGGQPIVGPDGKPLPDTGYFGRQGADAMAARDDAQTALDEAAQEQMSSLQTPAAREAFENQSRRYRAADMADMGGYADKQQKVWATGTNTTAITKGLNGVGGVAADDAASDLEGQIVIDAARKNARLAGEDPDGAELKARQEIVQTRIRALSAPQAGVAGAQKAEDVFEKNSGLLASLSNYDQIGRQVKEGVVNTQVGPAIDTAVQDAVTQAQAAAASGTATGVTNSYVAAVSGRETGGAPDAATARNPRSTAAGLDQFTDGTWLNVMKDPQFAAQTAGKTPAEILALKSDPGLQQQATLVYAKQNAPILQAVGEPVNAATLGLAHGYGPEGAVSILKADPATPASSVLSPAAMTANPNLANQTTGQIVASFTKRFGAGQVDTDTGAISGGQYPTTADALNATITSRTQQFHDDMTKQFPLFPDVVDRATANFQTRLEQQVTQQDRQLKVDSHVVMAAVSSPNPPASEGEFLATATPEVAAAWQRMKLNDYYGTRSIEDNVFGANARGAAPVYGVAFKDSLDRVLAPTGDPTRVGNAGQLANFVGKGNDAPLTNTGAGALNQLLGIRSGATGEAFARQAKAFVDATHGNLTFSNKGTGVVDTKGEELFGKFMSVAIPVMVRAQQAGNLAAVLDPNSKDYLGNVAATFARSPAALLKDRADYDSDVSTKAQPYGIHHPLLTGPAFTVDTLRTQLGSLENDRQRTEALSDFARAKRLTPQVYRAYLASLQGPGLKPGEIPPAPTPIVNVGGQ
jgi:hypothetical protein